MAKTIQRFNRTDFTQNRPRHGQPKKLSACAQCHIQRLCLGNRRMSVFSIAAEVERVRGQPVSAQTIRRTLHQIGLHGWVVDRLIGQKMYTVIQAVHSILYIVAKCYFFSVVTWKDIIKYFQKCEGCNHFCEILFTVGALYMMWNSPTMQCSGKKTLSELANRCWSVNENSLC